MSVTLNGTNGLTFNDGSSQATAAKVGMVNRIINGGMVIDQRNAGASGTGNDTYVVDRWAYFGSQASKATWQQNAGSVTPPAGFSNYFGFTSSSAYSVGATEIFVFSQKIEGFNTSDLNFGTANAQTITLSFWVRSSLTGTFGGYVANSAQNRNYPFSYTISSSNTWEQKSVTIAGDTTGTWIGGTNGIGMRVGFSLGIGSTNSTTANAWNGTTNAIGVTGATSVVGTNGATFYITGVQLEKNTGATGFDVRPYGTELQLAQRYYYRVVPDANAPFGVGWNINTTQGYINVAFPTVMRITPTAVEQNGTASNYRIREAGGGFICSSVVSFVNGSPSNSFVIFTVASGLTAGRGSFGESNSSGAYLGWSAEL